MILRMSRRQNGACLFREKTLFVIEFVARYIEVVKFVLMSTKQKYFGL